MEYTSEIDSLYKLSEKLGYAFKQPELLAEALRHSSYVNELSHLGLRDNERFEFLGDAVLDLAIGHILMELFQDATEGDLSKYRARIVNERELCQVARELELGDYLLLGKGEELSHGREKPSILADTMEAVLGAIYLDAGFAMTKEIVQSFFLPILEKIDSRKVVEDFKSLLQEYCQEIYKSRPQYLLVKEIGPAHDRTFRIELHLNGKTLAEGEGKSKKEAEQKAAKEAFLCLQENREDL